MIYSKDDVLRMLSMLRQLAKDWREAESLPNDIPLGTLASALKELTLA